jgi:hypothetical protein
MSTRKINRSHTTQLTDATEFNASNLIFDDPIENKIPGDDNLKFFRIPIGIKNPDGTEGDLVLGLDRCSSYGIQITRDMKTKELNGYSLALVLRDKDSPTERQEAGIKAIECVVEKAKDFILKVKGKMKMGDLERSDLKKLTPLFYKKDEDGVKDETAPPMLYPKLYYYGERVDKNKNVLPARIATTFYAEDEVDEHGEPVVVDPLQFLEKSCFATCAIKVEGIFVGSTAIKLQCKLFEADIKAKETGPKRLLRRFGMNAPSTPSVTLSGANPLFSKPSTDEVEEEDEEEQKEEEVKPTPVIVASEDEEEEVKPKKKPTKRGAK